MNLTSIMRTVAKFVRLRLEKKFWGCIESTEIKITLITTL